MAPAHLRYPIVLSVAAAVFTLALKGLAYYITDSIGLLSEAVESLVNLVAAVTALISLYYASKPIDSTHTYGHEKIEFFSSGLEGALILVGVPWICWCAIQRLAAPAELTQLSLGTAISLLASLVNLAVARVLLRVGRRHGSIVLEADGRHLMTDVWTSVGVVAGLGLVWLTGRVWVDPIIAMLVAANIAWTGIDLVRISFNGLMDHALPEVEQLAVRSAVESRLKPGMDYHALRTRKAGSRRFVDFHLLVPGAMSVGRAHEITAEIEEAVRQALPGIEVTVHIEPIEDRSAWEDSELVAIERAARQSKIE